MLLWWLLEEGGIGKLFVSKHSILSAAASFFAAQDGCLFPSIYLIFLRHKGRQAQLVGWSCCTGRTLSFYLQVLIDGLFAVV